MWLWLITMFRLHAAVQLRLGQAELTTRLVKLHVTGLALLAFLTQALINRSLVALFLTCSFVLLCAQRSARSAWTRYQRKTGASRARLLLVGEPSERMAEHLCFNCTMIRPSRRSVAGCGARAWTSYPNCSMY